MEFSSYTQPILHLLALLIVYGLWKIIENQRTKSKKSVVPEPKGAWPVIGHLHLLAGHDPICKILGSMADKYGPIYSLKLGRHRTLVVSSWEIVKECFTTNDRILATRPCLAAGKYLGYDNAVFALAPYGPYWRDVRKLATIELLSSHRLETFQPVRSKEIDSFLKHLNQLYTVENANKNNPPKVNISKLIEHLTFNMNLKLIAGKRFSAQEYDEKNSEACRIKTAIKKAMYLTGVFVAGDAIPWLEWMDLQGHVSSMKRTAKEIDFVIGKWLQEHVRAQGDNESEVDFMDVMLSKLPEDTVTYGHTRDTIIKATALILIFTGAESTFVAMTWALSLLLNHPKVLKAAQEELDIHVGRDKWVQESDIKKLKYLQAVVKETLRLYPPGPVTGLREAMEDSQIAGYHVPKGTRLIVNIWKLHRDPRLWQDPCKFQPDRFLTTHADVDFNDVHFEYIPFSYGRRSCPGMAAGLQLVHLTLARLLQGFNLATVDGMPVDMQEGLGIDLPKLKPLEAVIEPRLSSCLYQSLYSNNLSNSMIPEAEH